ncbi:OLC1v1015595C1 [Oldenlandia corymbosa var. corymbosa]|uniref:OLC1v1015595C1 n=1 Tax=Oldenlandia corymbosa var. corymbosa TaxID=529605 RepID=A0AAV1E6R1_OLDCO|nr:OLC1v1015595C1 [Oldenlandia corymbosa var. corymbosa]
MYPIVRTMISAILSPAKATARVVNVTGDGTRTPTSNYRLHRHVYTSVPFTGIDTSAATKHGIKVAKIPGGATGNADSCVEMAMFLMLGLLRRQVFIMGLGSIGISLAKRLHPFGVKIIPTKRSWEEGPFDAKNSCNFEGGLVDVKGNHRDIHDFAREANIVVCCLGMNTETGAILVNIARGGLLDYQAVFRHLKSGRLGGLGMDVAWNEPFDPDDDILKFPNVVGEVALQLHSGKPLKGIEIVN